MNIYNLCTGLQTALTEIKKTKSAYEESGSESTSGWSAFASAAPLHTSIRSATSSPVNHAGSGSKRQTLTRWKMFLFKEKLVQRLLHLFQTGREKLNPNSNLEGFYDWGGTKPWPTVKHDLNLDPGCSREEKQTKHERKKILVTKIQQNENLDFWKQTGPPGSRGVGGCNHIKNTNLSERWDDSQLWNLHPASKHIFFSCYKIWTDSFCVCGVKTADTSPCLSNGCEAVSSCYSLVSQTHVVRGSCSWLAPQLRSYSPTSSESVIAGTQPLPRISLKASIMSAHHDWPSSMKQTSAEPRVIMPPPQS